MSKLSSSHSFVNVRYAVSDTVRLSMSSWETATGCTYAVALLDKQGRRWVVNSETAVEFSSRDRKDAGIRATDYGAKLVAQVLGECASRFYRDALVA